MGSCAQIYGVCAPPVDTTHQEREEHGNQVEAYTDKPINRYKNSYIECIRGTYDIPLEQ